jgi:hypothetical protein
MESIRNGRTRAKNLELFGGVAEFVSRHEKEDTTPSTQLLCLVLDWTGSPSIGRPKIKRDAKCPSAQRGFDVVCKRRCERFAFAKLPANDADEREVSPICTIRIC